MVKFRDVYHKICAFELNDHLKKVAKDCPDVKTAKYAVFFGFIDPEKGLMLELLGTAKSGKTRINPNEPYQGKRVTISIKDVADDVFFKSGDLENFPKYIPRIEAVGSDFISDEIEKSRTNELIDPFRDEIHPDHIKIRLKKSGMKDEKVLAGITGITNNEFIGVLLEKPNQNFGLKKGDEIRFTIERGEDYKPVDCIADLDNNEPDSASSNRYKYQLDDGLISSSEKVILTIGSADVYNYALDINEVYPIRDVCIRNITLDPIEDILVRVTCESNIFDSFEYHIQKIKAKDKFPFDIPLTVHHNQLISLSEAVKVNFQIDLISIKTNEILCPPIKWDMDVLAYNQWPGDNYIKYLPAFVMPNRPYIKDLQKIAVSWLKKIIKKYYLRDTRLQMIITTRTGFGILPQLCMHQFRRRIYHTAILRHLMEWGSAFELEIR